MISFCIPAHNEERLLPATLHAIHTSATAAGIEYEIIVANDASTDRTPEIAGAGGARVVTIDRRQISASRNAAARASHGEWLFFVDADTQVTPETVREALALLGGGAVGGGCLIDTDGEVPRYGKVMLALLIPLFRVLNLAGGAAMFCTRSAYGSVGGWDEALFASEEITFARALKRQGRFALTRANVITSGRKLRTHSAREIFGPLLRLMVQGRRGIMRREGLEMWYGERRDDPSG